MTLSSLNFDCVEEPAWNSQRLLNKYSYKSSAMLELKLKTIRDVRMCADLCEQKSDCKVYVFDSSSKKCLLNSQKLNPHQLVESPRNVVGIPPKGLSRISNKSLESWKGIAQWFWFGKVVFYGTNSVILYGRTGATTPARQPSLNRVRQKQRQSAWKSARIEVLTHVVSLYSTR